MDKTSIKNFAVWARRKLIEDVKQKAYEIGITEDSIIDAVAISSDSGKVRGNTLNKYELRQRVSLISKINEKGYGEVIEEAAYTWFNRFIAIRFMEVNGYLPSGVRVLSSTESGKFEPDIIKRFEYMDMGLTREDLYNLHNMMDENDTESLYSFLLIRQCNKLNEILPGLFEKIEDYTEILLPDNLLSEGSVIRRLVCDIPEKDYKDQVEIIGWMYQYYISEKKDEVFAGLKKNIKITKENIAAATQLFTPDWIVKYMVENSLGRLWLEGHADDGLKDGWKYYLNEANQESDVQKQLNKIRDKSKNIKPEEIKVLDPAMGSGHILVYAFDVLYDIYKSSGYSEKDIPKLILEKNLYGLEIDDRAAQLAYFALMMKARSKLRGIFREKINLNLCSIQESNGFDREGIDLLAGPENNADDIEYLIDIFNDAKEYGSIIDVKPLDFDCIEKRIKKIESEDLPLYKLELRDSVLKKIRPLVKQGRIMSQEYDVVVTNPPYMGNRSMNEILSKYIKENYPKSKTDMFSVFMERCISLTESNKFCAMITQPSWLFLSKFEELRLEILDANCIYNLIHMGRGIFGIDFGSCAFVIRKGTIPNYAGQYFKLYKRVFQYIDPEYIKKMFLNSKHNKDYGFNFSSYNMDCTCDIDDENDINDSKIYFEYNQSYFNDIPGSPIAYWVKSRLRDTFKNEKRLIEFIDVTGSQNITGNNEKYLRFIWEVDSEKIGHEWVFYLKGGDYRKWYGNIEYVVDWSMKARQFYKNNKTSNLLNERYWFRKGITYNGISVRGFTARLAENAIYDKKGPTFHVKDHMLEGYILSLLNTKVTDYIMAFFNPTLSYQMKDVNNIPIIKCSDEKQLKMIDAISNKNLQISKSDWDSYETSWNFKKHPILKYMQGAKTIKQAFENWSEFKAQQFGDLKCNEEELNNIFINIYGLQDELVQEVMDKDVTISKADRVRDIKSFISYAVGCMFGRYSIDVDGLIYAGGKWDGKWKFENGKWKVRNIIMDNYGEIAKNSWIDASFCPDYDNIIPIVDDEYFNDDIVSRFAEFVRAVFGDQTLEENLDYIAETVGKKSYETSRQSIRRYFIKDFYKDHVQIYQKRPIYWLFDSGKNDGFKALIYMHRYDEFTLPKIRMDYLHKLQYMYEAEYNRLDIVIDSDSSEREKSNARNKKEMLQKQMVECKEYDQFIAHAANMRIRINLDDGVKANYDKFNNIEVHQGEGKKSLKVNLLSGIRL